MLEIKNINITFKKTIYKDADIVFNNSSIHAITGKSGSGKTTFFKYLINGELDIYYNGNLINNSKDFIKNHVAYVDQLGTYFPNMTIYQHFQFYSEIYNKVCNKKISIQFLNKVNLENININQSPSILSIGERKRFLISLALFCDKDILILDEPTASLDLKNIALLKQVLKKLDDKIIILSTHTPEILEICDTIYEVQNCKFMCKKSQCKENNEKFKVLRKKIQLNPFKYFKYKNTMQWIQFVGMIVISLFIIFQCSITLISTATLSQTDPIVTNKSSKEMLFLRNRYGELNLLYTPSSEQYQSQPISKEVEKTISMIDGVNDIELFDVLTIYNPNNIEETQSLKIEKKNGETKDYSMIEYGSQAPTIFPYYNDNDFFDEKNGVYINQNMAETFDIQVGDTLKAKFYIPFEQYEIKEGNEFRRIAYAIKNLEFKVTKILNEKQGYISHMTDLCVYIDNNQMQQIIRDAKNNSTVMLNNALEAAASKTKAKSYQTSEYVLFVDENKLVDIYENLIEMDDHFDVSSIYLEHLAIAQQTQSLASTKYIIMVGILLIGFAIIITIQYFNAKSRKKEIMLLNNIGFNSNEIKKSLIVQYIICYGIFIIFSILLICLIMLNNADSIKLYPIILSSFSISTLLCVFGFIIENHIFKKVS